MEVKNVVVTLFLCSVYCTYAKITCKDENNNAVGWSYMYKLPKNKFTKNDLIKEGVAYMFITPDTLKNGWTLSDLSINDTNSMPGLALNYLYQKDNKILSLIYNDQPFDSDDVKPKPTSTTARPKKTPKSTRNRRRINSSDEDESDSESSRSSPVRIKTTGGGHTKGVVISDGVSGIWLVHSVPKYPPLPDASPSKYSYPNTAMRFGQSFLCLSLTSNEINKVGLQLKYNEPKILYKQLPKEFEDRFKNVYEVANKMTVKSPPWHSIVNLTTINGASFTSFAKSANFRDDLYEALVAPTFKRDLLVETWRNGPKTLNSTCSYKFKVKNIDKIAFFDKGIAFTSSTDHSKWAITNCSKNCGPSQWICVGDINRAESQEVRGGGTVCINNRDIWSQYSRIVNVIEECGA